MSANPQADRDATLARCRPWLHVLASLEIDSRFQGKFSASDVVQQTLLEAWRDWDHCQGQEHGQRMAWLRQILAHRLAHAAREFASTRKRDVRREVSLEESLAQSSQRLGAILAAPGPSPSGEAARHEEQLRLAAVLDRLPADYRQVIVLRNLQDLPHEEVARRMGRTPGAVRMLWMRALAELRRQISR